MSDEIKKFSHFVKSFPGPVAEKLQATTTVKTRKASIQLPPLQTSAPALAGKASSSPRPTKPASPKPVAPVPAKKKKGKEKRS